jgi:hypothetical protein
MSIESFESGWLDMRAAIVQMLHEGAARFGHDDDMIRMVCKEALRPVPEAYRAELVEECLALYYAS